MGLKVTLNSTVERSQPKVWEKTKHKGVNVENCKANSSGQL